MVVTLPRAGFFTTPAFFANWQTNGSNQHRVTMNQTLIVALGKSFDGNGSTVPISENGLDEEHASDPACYACHRTLDPMRQFFRQSFTIQYGQQTDAGVIAQNGRILRFRWHDDLFFHNRPKLTGENEDASPPPQRARGTLDSQRGAATVHNPPLPFQRREGPAVNLDY